MSSYACLAAGSTGQSHQAAGWQNIVPLLVRVTAKPDLGISGSGFCLCLLLECLHLAETLTPVPDSALIFAALVSCSRAVALLAMAADLVST